jgi:hypothetical protein
VERWGESGSIPFNIQDVQALIKDEPNALSEIMYKEEPF